MTNFSKKVVFSCCFLSVISLFYLLHIDILLLFFYLPNITFCPFTFYSFVFLRLKEPFYLFTLLAFYLSKRLFIFLLFTFLPFKAPSYWFILSSSSILVRLFERRGILCCPPSFPFVLSQSLKSSLRATTISTGCKVTLWKRFAS